MVHTNKEINLTQLDQELGSQGLVANFEDSANKIIKAAEGSTVTEAQLKSAIDAHSAIDDDAIRATAKASGLTKLAALGFTEAEIAAW